jgi:hypothetical protein
MGKSTFRLLIYKNKLYISVNEGLRLIGVDINWIPDDPKDRRGIILKKINFSFDRKLFCYQIENSGKYIFVEAYSYQDWLTLWEYFAKRGNSRAMSVLKWLAQFGMEQHIKSFGF